MAQWSRKAKSFSRRPGINAQQSHQGSQPSLIVVPGESNALFWFLRELHAFGAYIHTRKTLIHIK